MADRAATPDIDDGSASEAVVEEQPSFHLSWPHQILSVIGFAIGLYSYRAHMLAKAGEHVACGSTNTFNCDKALTSNYAEFFNIPLGVFGMVYFALIFILSIDTDLRPEALRRSILLRFLVTAAGLAGSLCLVYIMKFELHAWCSICLATHVVNLLVFIASLVALIRGPRLASGKATATRAATSTDATASPGAAGSS